MIFVIKAFKDSHDLAGSNFSSVSREPLSGCEAAAALKPPPQLFLPTRKYGESEACAGVRKTSDTPLNPDTQKFPQGLKVIHFMETGSIFVA
ncbi:hypothetical protein [Alkalilimnicola ehrlichii]|uniref:hypothetical protein n=1 Tax=Alkalilimnicola ehrlichii TaxID=351052 RepID=UPI003B9EF873